MGRGGLHGPLIGIYPQPDASRAQQTCPCSHRSTSVGFGFHLSKHSVYHLTHLCMWEWGIVCIFPLLSLCPSFSYSFGIVLTWVRRCYWSPHSNRWPFHVHAVNGLTGSIAISEHWIIGISSWMKEDWGSLWTLTLKSIILIVTFFFFIHCAKSSCLSPQMGQNNSLIHLCKPC